MGESSHTAADGKLVSVIVFFDWPTAIDTVVVANSVYLQPLGWRIKGDGLGMKKRRRGGPSHNSLSELIASAD